MSGKWGLDVLGVVMAGGDGERLWPVSTRERPKQFQDLLGLGETMLQSAARRLSEDCAASHVLVVTSGRHVYIAAEQLGDASRKEVLGEPRKCSTAPCVALVTAWALREMPEAVMVVVPSDHYIADERAYGEAVRRAVEYASGHDSLVTFGIPPRRAATEYGYVEMGDEIERGVRRVVRFREKPDAASAERFVRSGAFLWNSGMFVWKVASIASALRAHMPGLLELMETLPFGAPREELTEEMERVYAGLSPESIDRGVMEKAEDVVVLPASFGWSDVGTWPALKELLPRDAQGNGHRGVVEFVDCNGVLAWVEKGEEARLEGLRECIVALRGGRLLVREMKKE